MSHVYCLIYSFLHSMEWLLNLLFFGNKCITREVNRLAAGHTVRFVCFFYSSILFQGSLLAIAPFRNSWDFVFTCLFSSSVSHGGTTVGLGVSIYCMSLVSHTQMATKGNFVLPVVVQALFPSAEALSTIRQLTDHQMIIL